MKIVFITNRLGPGGAERTIAYLSDYFANHNYNVSIVIDTNEVFYSLNPNINIICLNMPSHISRSLLRRALTKMVRRYKQRRALKREKPDVVIAIPTSSAELICSYKNILGFKLIVSERSNPQFVSSAVMKKNNKVFPYADGVIFQTNNAKAFYPRWIQEKSCVIANAIGNPLVNNVHEPLKRENKVVAIGRLHPVKDYPTLLKAFRIVNVKYPDYRLEIYGDGDEKEKLIQLAKDLNISNVVSFMGNREDAIVCAASAACYVLSSKHEGMPNSLLEAMAVGLPCVSTACPNGPDELINNGKNGLLVPVGNEKAMANAILQMIEDKSLADACGREAKKVLHTHSVEKTAEEFLSFIKL